MPFFSTNTLAKLSILCLPVLLASPACNTDDGLDENRAILLVIDDDCIDNGNPPNNFSETDVNDQLAELGFRLPLLYFQNNVGKTIDLYTGQVGDEGLFALKSIPDSWVYAGPTPIGARNFLTPGPGLGAMDDENLLDDIPHVTPLRATGLNMLIGHRVIAVVYDSDISINYFPSLGNLQGANLGLVAFEVVGVHARTDGSSSDLPRISVRVLDVLNTAQMTLMLFSNAPVLESSSVPMDVTPDPAATPITLLLPAP